jgi:hypothetical protein
MMKTNHIFGIAILFIALVAALVLLNFNPSLASAQNMAASASLQATPNPAGEGISEIGSTDGIMLMGVLITMIAIIPVLLRKQKK